MAVDGCAGSPVVGKDPLLGLDGLLGLCMLQPDVVQAINLHVRLCQAVSPNAALPTALAGPVSLPTDSMTNAQRQN